MQLIKLKLLVQRRELKWLILNKRRRLFHSSRVKLPLVRMVFGVNVTNLDFWVFIDSVKQPIQRNSVGPWNMSHRGTLAFDNHLNHGFIVSKTYNMAPAPDCIVLDEMWSMLVGTTLVCLHWMSGTVWNWSLCLAHPTFWHERVTSENARVHLILILKLRDPLQNESLERIQVYIAVLCFPHNSMSVFTCVMNVRDQTRQAFVTRFCPFRHRKSKVVQRPQNMRSPHHSEEFDELASITGKYEVSQPFWGVWWASQHYGSPRICLLHIQRYFLTFQIWCLPGFLMQTR